MREHSYHGLGRFTPSVSLRSGFTPSVSLRSVIPPENSPPLSQQPRLPLEVPKPRNWNNRRAKRVAMEGEFVTLEAAKESQLYRSIVASTLNLLSARRFAPRRSVYVWKHWPSASISSTHASSARRFAPRILSPVTTLLPTLNSELVPGVALPHVVHADLGSQFLPYLHETEVDALRYHLHGVHGDDSRRRAWA